MSYVAAPNQVGPLLAAGRSRLADPHVHVAPEIPPDKLAHARAAYAGDVDPAEVLLLVDASVFGDAALGGLLTATAIHGCDTGDRVRSVPWNQVRAVAYVDDPGGAVLSVNDVPTVPLGLVHRDVGQSLAHLLRMSLGIPLTVPPQPRTYRNRSRGHG